MESQVIQITKTYRQLFREFLEQSSIHGLKIFLLSVSARYAKKLWLAFFTLVVIWTHVVIAYMIADFLHQPTEMILSTNMVHVANSPFPGVAICSANKISRRKLSTYAEQVFNAQQSYRPNLLARNASELSEQLVCLAGFFMHALNDFQPNDIRWEHLHSIFTHMYNSTNYSLRDVLHSLAPNCDDIVIRARVLGENIDVRDFFVQRTTSSSVCCMFNYRRESYSLNISTKRNHENYIASKVNDIKIESNSLLNNIQFVAQYDENDITYKNLANEAFQLSIFPNQDYPSLQSNNIGDLLVEHNSIIEIPIQPRFFASSSSVGDFSPEVRKCYFPFEGQKLLNLSYYSLDECLLICRIQSMIKYCGCVAPPLIASFENVTFCSFMDLACLTKWKAVWYGSNYFDYAYAETGEMKSAYERCDHCLPTCDGIEFDFDVNIMPLSRPKGPIYTHGILAGLSNHKPLAIIKIFFMERYASETIKDVKADWVLLLNRFGGILSLMYGFSIISYIEIFYYLSGKWFFHFFTRKSKVKDCSKTKEFEKNQNLKEKFNSKPPQDLELYWLELKPKCVNLNGFREPPILQFPKNLT